MLRRGRCRLLRREHACAQAALAVVAGVELKALNSRQPVGGGSQWMAEQLRAGLELVAGECRAR